MFQKNLEYINNDALKNRLSGLKLEETRWDMSYCMTPSNDYLLMKNDIPLDDIENPRKAVQDMLKSMIKQPMGANDIIITFGIGLCYLLDETFNTYPSKIFVYEPDIKLLHFVLNNVDISEHLSSGRVYITDKLEELLKKLSDTYITKDKVEVVYLKNYAVVKNQELLELTQKVYETCKSKMIDVSTIVKYSKNWALNTLKNIGAINNGNYYKLSDLEDKFIGQTALVIAAGPSFADDIEKIKANRDKFVIFAVNKVLRNVLQAGINPDFVVCLDAEFIDKTFMGLEEQLPSINCITDVKASSTVFNTNFKKTFVSFSENEIIMKKIKEYNPSIKTYETGGSASTMALVAAIKMGFSKVIFSGLDLAFKDSVMYSSGEEIQKIDDNTMKFFSKDKKLTEVLSVTGQMVQTREDYASFIKHFETLIKDLGYMGVYNTTSFGAAINGMKNKPLNEISLLVTSNTTSIILGEANPFKIETKLWTQNELALINAVISLLSDETFSPALVSAIVKSPLLYEYLQADILQVLQSRMDEGLAEEFLNKAKSAIKDIIDTLQKNRLI